MLTIYGLASCDTCKKAMKWLVRGGIAHEFVDYREHRIDSARLIEWSAQVGGWERLVNRASTTWRGLPEARKSPETAPEWTLLIREYPALVRRPLAVQDGTAIGVGFNDKLYRQWFG